MGETSTVPLIVAFVGLIGTFVAVLNIDKHPVIRSVLLTIILFIVVLFVWYVAPAMKLDALAKDRERLYQTKAKADTSVQDEARQIVEAQEKIAQANRDAAVFKAQKDAALAKRESDIAAAAEIEQRQHTEALQAALQAQKDLDLKSAVLGTWKCTYGLTMTFKTNGIVSQDLGFDSTYKVVDSAHLEITSYSGHGVTLNYDLNLNGPEQTIKLWGVQVCERPRG